MTSYGTADEVHKPDNPAEFVGVCKAIKKTQALHEISILRSIWSAHVPGNPADFRHRSLPDAMFPRNNAIVAFSLRRVFLGSFNPSARIRGSKKPNSDRVAIVPRISSYGKIRGKRDIFYRYRTISWFGSCLAVSLSACQSQMSDQDKMVTPRSTECSGLMRRGSAG